MRLCYSDAQGVPIIKTKGRVKNKIPGLSDANYSYASQHETEGIRGGGVMSSPSPKTELIDPVVVTQKPSS
jgi:hypothetical protein